MCLGYSRGMRRRTRRRDTAQSIGVQGGEADVAAAESQREVVTVRIDGLATGGDAVGRQESGAHVGRATFVPLAAPGETVLVRLLREKARVAWGEMESVASAPSPHRVTPPCPVFGECGGCQWQHVSLDVQREAKRQIVARALGWPDVTLRSAVPTAAAAAVAGSPTATSDGAWAYRERARLSVGPSKTLGFRARRSHAIVDVVSCALLSPALATVLTSIRSDIDALPADTEIDLQAGREGVHANVRVPRARGPRDAAQTRIDAQRFAQDILDRHRAAGLVGVCVDASDAREGGSAASAGDEDVDVSEAGGPALRIPAGGFSQVGRWANAALVGAALEALGATPGNVLELYAGSGNFTRHLCATTNLVTASDGDRDARARGRLNAPGADWVAEPPRELHADTVFVDPPRGGLDAIAMAAALRARQQVIYVSCDPQTLGRDAQRLVSSGFRLASVVALDLMPQTYHVEVVAKFVRVP